jgi:hypothetical protein
VLYARLDYVDGTISIEWLKVMRVESSQLFLVETQDGSQYRGVLKTEKTPAEEPVKIEVEETGPDQKVLERDQIVQLNQTSESFWRRFSGNLDTSLIYSKGNNTTQYSVGAGLTYLRERWSGQATFNSTLSGSSGDRTSTRNQLDLNALRLMRWNNWFYTSIGDFLQSSQQEISLQTTLGGGIGRFLKNTNRSRILLAGGLAWQDTKYQSSNTPLGTPANALAGMVSGDVEVFVFKQTSLSLRSIVFPVLSQAGRVRIYTNAAYSVKIFKDLWWKVSFYDNFDNRPPVTFSGNDFGTSSGISFSFH